MGQKWQPCWIFWFLGQKSKTSQIPEPGLQIFTQGSSKRIFRIFGWLVHSKRNIEAIFRYHCDLKVSRLLQITQLQANHHFEKSLWLGLGTIYFDAIIDIFFILTRSLRISQLYVRDPDLRPSPVVFSTTVIPRFTVLLGGKKKMHGKSGAR